MDKISNEHVFLKNEEQETITEGCKKEDLDWTYPEGVRDWTFWGNSEGRSRWLKLLGDIKCGGRMKIWKLKPGEDVNGEGGEVSGRCHLAEHLMVMMIIITSKWLMCGIVVFGWSSSCTRYFKNVFKVNYRNKRITKVINCINSELCVLWAGFEVKAAHACYPTLGPSPLSWWRSH